MFKNAFVAIGTAARDLVRHRGALVIFNLLYAALLASLYLFVSTKEATVGQLILTTLLACVAPILFFMLQGAGATYAQAPAARPTLLLRRSLRDGWKLALISLPLIALAVLIIYLLNKLQAYLAVAPAATQAPPARFTPYPPPTPPTPFSWPDVLFTTLRLLLVGLALPLMAMHLWLAIARDGLKATLRKSLRILARAFAPTSILIYGTGLLLFGLMPYFLVFTRTPVKNAWGELVIFGLRLALAFVFTLWGWIITLGALGKTLATNQEAGVSAEQQQITDEQEEVRTPVPTQEGAT